jgi:hypothetical protein
LFSYIFAFEDESSQDALDAVEALFQTVEQEFEERDLELRIEAAEVRLDAVEARLDNRNPNAIPEDARIGFEILQKVRTDEDGNVEDFIHTESQYARLNEELKKAEMRPLDSMVRILLNLRWLNFEF